MTDFQCWAGGFCAEVDQSAAWTSALSRRTQPAGDVVTSSHSSDSEPLSYDPAQHDAAPVVTPSHSNSPVDCLSLRNIPLSLTPPSLWWSKPTGVEWKHFCLTLTRNSAFAAGAYFMCATCNALHGQLPQYLAEDCQLLTDIGRQSLWSADVLTCATIRTRTRLGDIVSVAGPCLWNSLRSAITWQRHLTCTV